VSRLAATRDSITSILSARAWAAASARLLSMTSMRADALWIGSALSCLSRPTSIPDA
jgi:hypothetical protein